ncbi:lysozyme inhibitor LprI family protein [Gottfriedia sp. NPDC056225]|uniref:lysozyme inhibitor LprI family protein n=1 Tax=Gottfriedia sp. NPDC056225 TaxID=3345751 RepID=UPI0035DB6215
MKKLILVVVIFLLAGCSNEAYDKSLKKGNEALRKGEYDKAQVAYELALEEKPDDTNTKEIYIKLVEFNKVKDLYEQQKWDEAIKEGNDLLNEKSVPNYLRTELNTIINNSTANLKKSDTAVNTAPNNTTSKTDDSKGSTATNQPVEKNESKSTDKGNAEKNKVNLQKKYLTKLNKIDKSMSDLDYLYKKGITSELTQAETEKLNRWDKALNEIYQILMKMLPSSDASNLKGEERTWVKEKESIAKKEAAKYQGGTFENVQYLNSLGRLTKERAYKLVYTYMD